MRKLARNIITGTALAVGGLTQTSASETTRPETQTSNSGGLNAATGASIGVSALVGAATIGAGYLQYKGNKELTAKGQEESARHNKVQEEREEAKDKEEKTAAKIGATTSEVRKIIGNLNNIRRKRKLGTVNESVVQTVLDRGKSGAKVLLAGKDAVDATHETAMFKALRDEIKESSNRNKLIGDAIDKLANGPVTKNTANSWVALTGKGASATVHQVKVADSTLVPEASVTGAFANAVTASAGAQGSGTAKYDEASYAAGDCLLAGELKELLGGCVPVGWAALTPDKSGTGAWLGNNHRGFRVDQMHRLTLGDSGVAWGQAAANAGGPYAGAKNGNGLGCLIIGRDIANPGVNAEVFGFNNDEISGVLNPNTRAKLNNMIGKRTVAAINYREVPDEKEDENGDW